MIIIISTLEDITARAVAWTLERAGISTYLLDLLSFPSEQTCSVLTRNKDTVVEIGKNNEGISRINIRDVRVVWNRRLNSRYFDLRRIHRDDIRAAYVEARAVAFNLHEIINASLQICPINSLASARAARSKLLQHQVARKVGLTVPDTLVSNDFRIVKAFFKKNLGNVIFKPFYQHQWNEGDHIYFQWTSRLKPEQLDNEIIGISPGIYQSLVDKDYELRIMAINGEFLAAKLNTQDLDSTLIDSRGDVIGDLNIEPTKLPSGIEEMLRAFMSELGLVHGCIDMIVTTSGEYVFLEVNESGQFLWTEALNDDIPALSTFCTQLAKLAGHADIGLLTTFREFKEFVYRDSDCAQSAQREKVYDELAELYTKANIGLY